MNRLAKTLAMGLTALLIGQGTVLADNHDKKGVDKDIVETALAAGSFNTLAKALTEAGLVETLKGKGPFTVFAPTDEAFAKLPKGALDGLLKDKEQLKKVLLYHVVSGTVMAADVVKLKEATTVEGSTVAITVKDKDVMVNGAKVVTTDVKASNGVIHVIDTVILPPAEKPAMKEVKKEMKKKSGY